ncbi:acyl-ACP--UDP-N-acetylglucosamine O-acyltransferase [Marinicauda algicola]|uniref:Acyl-ACP--UDP-N-acetylglucosamine O-acyltransferase n=1 Tax=Marinicauda algicola TaxID=2029849 RepID=A0A4S2GWH5_9PROT|nr:acyl-ACP--UDP-N-acetylglucosamine O-acyltransferase [Marinicauda algicola]TGY87416.1 acyl-ACP--UDP-N-acetylglucosamine O-acyltransferase [Marinicauda algicola]
MASKIHPTAIVDPEASIGEDVEIGPYCIVGAKVVIKARTRLISHVTIYGRTEIGEDCAIYPFVVLGSPPQDFKYKGGDVSLVIGPRNTLREHTTMHLGTESGRGVTRIGADGYYMVGSHVAHDCIVGDRVVFANNATLGGGVTLGDYVIMGGLAAIHQNCRVGRHAFVGAGSSVTGDVIPYGMVDNDGWLAGLNLVGLKRRGFSRDVIHDLRAAYRMIYATEGKFTERVEDAARLFGEREEVREVIAFIQTPAARPLCTPQMR